MDTATTTNRRVTPWNKGKLLGQKPPLRLKEIWAIRIRLQLDHRTRELALFNLAIDSKLRGCDLVGLRVHDVVQGSHVAARAIVMQKKTQRPVQFEITEQTRSGRSRSGSKSLRMLVWCSFRRRSESMNRRGALAMLGGSLLLARTVGAKAQAAKSVRHIGFLGPGSAPNPAFLQRLWAPTRELGWIEGENLIIERRYAQGKAELLKSYAEELVRLNVELIVTNGTPATIAARNATTRIPIVIYSAGDPVRSGLVASLARPGGNITGYSIVARELDAKRLELLQELLPTAQRVAVLIDPTNPYNETAREERERVYRSLGVQPIFVGAAAASEFENAVSEAARRRAQALIVPVDNLYWTDRVLLMRTALEHRLPTIVGHRDILEAGGLLSLAIDEAEQYRALAYFVDKILRGAKPADLPVQQPSKLLVSVNLKTAKALGFTIPQSLLLRADEVIE